jgi:hypothetical protein
MLAGLGKLKGHLTWISGLMVVGKRTAVSTSERARAAIARREARMTLSRSQLPQDPTSQNFTMPPTYFQLSAWSTILSRGRLHAAPDSLFLQPVLGLNHESDGL